MSKKRGDFVSGERAQQQHSVRSTTTTKTCRQLRITVFLLPLSPGRGGQLEPHERKAHPLGLLRGHVPVPSRGGAPRGPTSAPRKNESGLDNDPASPPNRRTPQHRDTKLPSTSGYTCLKNSEPDARSALIGVEGPVRQGTLALARGKGISAKRVQSDGQALTRRGPRYDRTAPRGGREGVMEVSADEEQNHKQNFARVWLLLVAPRGVA